MTSLTYAHYQVLDTEWKLPIPRTTSRIAICMSGGLDSTLLASQIIKHHPLDRIKIFTFDLTKSVEVVDRILKYWRIDNLVEREVLANPQGENGSLAKVLKAQSETVDWLYTGINSNPPFADNIPDGEKPHRYKVVRHENILMPFGLLHKSHIVEQCFLLGEDKTILPLTWTCTERKDVSCGFCFACRERKWAFESARRKDVIKYDQ